MLVLHSEPGLGLNSAFGKSRSIYRVIQILQGIG